MTITDLPSTVPNPPHLRGDGASDDLHLDGPADGPVIERAGDGGFSLELPEDAPVVIETVLKGDSDEITFDDAPHTEVFADAPEADPEDRTVADEFASTLARAAAPPRPPLPSYAVVLIGGLALTCLALCVALVAALSRPAAAPIRVVAPPAAIDAPPAPEAAPETVPVEPPSDAAPAASPVDFPADPVPIPVDLITALEASSSEPLEVELSRLLDALGHSFGRQSARLEPTLRPFVYRMAARFEWNPNTFRVAVTAPDARLAEARKTLLESLFEEAVASGRLAIGSGTGPHALNLVTE